MLKHSLFGLCAKGFGKQASEGFASYCVDRHVVCMRQKLL